MAPFSVRIEDLRLKCCMDYSEKKISISGSYKYHVILKKTRSTICTFQPVFINLVRSPKRSLCICYLLYQHASSNSPGRSEGEPWGGQERAHKDRCEKTCGLEPDDCDSMGGGD